jgi:hypothetical protein
MAESFRILSPTDGAVVGRTVTLVARRKPRLGYPRYSFTTVSVRVGAAGPVVAATNVGALDWQATGVLPAGTLGGAQIDVSVTVEGSVIVNLGTDDDPVEETEEFTESESVRVVAESTFPEVRFDPYPHDVTVSTLPYRLELTGTAADVGGGVASVEVVLDGGAPVAARDLSGDWSKWAVEFDMADGNHTLRARATDLLGNVGTWDDIVSVKQPTVPGAEEQVFAIGNYLREIVGTASRYVRLDGATSGPTVAELGSMLRQPLDRLIEPDEFASATAGVAQARVAVEVLRGVLRHPAPVALDQRFRARAYEMVLQELGTSSEEVRLSRTADDATRQSLASRLGIALEGSRPDRLDAITIAPDEISDGELEQLFGYRSTNPPDPLAIPEPTLVSLWQHDALRAAWLRVDNEQRDGADGPLPVIDPDVIVEAHIRNHDPEDTGHRIWRERRAWIDDQLADITDVLQQIGTTPDSFDAALAEADLTIDLVALAEQDEDGVDITAELAVLSLTLEAFRYLVRVRALVAAGTVAASEWLDVASILAQVRKRQVFGQWRLEERQNGVVLQPSAFVAFVSDDAVTFAGALRWRASPVTLSEWRRTLVARERQADALSAGQQAAIEAVERDVLPALRDALIEEVARRQPAPEVPQATAERLSRELSLDFRTAPGTRTTRAGQAVDSLQSLLVAARSGRLTTVTGGTAATIADEASFDEEWAWLETYSRWRSAIEAFAYPENRLLPGLFVPEFVAPDRRLAPTQAFLTLMSGTEKVQGLVALSRVGPDLAQRLADTYLEQVRAETGSAELDDVVLTQRRSNAELSEHRRRCTALTSAPPGQPPFTQERQIPQHLREIFLLVPLALARKLHDCGHYAAALDWYGSVFAPQLPQDQRLIYHGLVLESATQSDFARTPVWLTFVDLLNPHFTSQHRNRAYTRFTVMSIVECLLGFADSEFARNAPDSSARARALYQNAADLLDLPEVAPESGPTVPFPVNPVWQALRARADIGLAKIHAGLNIAGELDIATSATDNVLPTVYRYGVIVERAKTLVSIAQQLESAYLSALERLDAANYDLLNADRDLRVAQGTLTAQSLRVDAAVSGVEQAELQRDRAQIQFGTYDQWIQDGLSSWEEDTLDAIKASAIFQQLAVVALGFSVIHESGKTGATLGLLGDPGGTLGHMLQAEGGVASSAAQFAQTKAGFERRKQEWELNRSLASKDIDIANRQVAAAQTQHGIAEADRQVAIVQMNHAAAVAEFLATKFTNADLYEFMSGVLGRVYQFFLQQATAVARLAQAQLAFERQAPLERFIAADYWQPVTDADSGAAELAPDRRGITGSTRLLQDLYRLDQQAFDTDRRKLHLTQTIAVSEIAAFELQQFRDTGVLTFATPEVLFDRDFPGHYLRLVKRVTVKMVALVSPLRGLRATLSASGVSRTVVPRDGFQTVTLRREPESISFTSPVSANGLFELEPEGAMLAPFEGMGIDAVWQLSLPKPANPIDYRAIADVLLTIEYTALDSPDYRQKVIRSLDPTFSGERSFSLRNQFPDAWYDLNNPDTVDPATRMRAVLAMTRDDFPPHVADLTVAHLTLFVVHTDRFADELSVMAMRHTNAGHTSEAGEVRTVGGIAGTRRPGAAPWQVFLDAEPAGTWELQFEDTAAVRSAFTEEAVQDIVLVFTLAGTTPPWPA